MTSFHIKNSKVIRIENNKNKTSGLTKKCVVEGLLKTNNDFTGCEERNAMLDMISMGFLLDKLAVLSGSGMLPVAASLTFQKMEAQTA